MRRSRREEAGKKKQVRGERWREEAEGKQGRGSDSELGGSGMPSGPHQSREFSKSSACGIAGPGNDMKSVGKGAEERPLPGLTERVVPMEGHSVGRITHTLEHWESVVCNTGDLMERGVSD